MVRKPVIVTKPVFWVTKDGKVEKLVARTRINILDSKNAVMIKDGRPLKRIGSRWVYQVK